MKFISFLFSGLFNFDNSRKYSFVTFEILTRLLLAVLSLSCQMTGISFIFNPLAAERIVNSVSKRKRCFNLRQYFIYNIFIGAFKAAWIIFYLESEHQASENTENFGSNFSDERPFWRKSPDKTRPIPNHCRFPTLYKNGQSGQIGGNQRP